MNEQGVVDALAEHRRHTTELLEGLEVITSALPRAAASVSDVAALSSLTDHLRLSDRQLAGLMVLLTQIVSPCSL
jgi:hypothetical protein